MPHEGLAGYDAARSEAALFDVSDRGKVAVTGKEAASFLHNLSTNDVKNLKPGTGCELFRRAPNGSRETMMEQIGEPVLSS